MEALWNNSICETTNASCLCTNEDAIGFVHSCIQRNCAIKDQLGINYQSNFENL